MSPRRPAPPAPVPAPTKPWEPTRGVHLPPDDSLLSVAPATAQGRPKVPRYQNPEQAAPAAQRTVGVPVAQWLGNPPPGVPEVPWREVRSHIYQTNPHRGRHDDRNALRPDNNDPVSRFRWFGPVAIDFEDPLVRRLPAAHPEDVASYKRQFLEGSDFPTVAMIWGDTWRTEGQLVMYDGAHRLQAALECGGPIETFIGVRKGSRT